MEPTQIAGTYQLTGIMETAAGLELYPDGKFDFYFSYGAIDRHAYGIWKSDNDKIELQSDYNQKSGYDIVLSEHREQPRFTILFPKADAFFLQMETVFAITNDVSEEQHPDKKGWCLFAQSHADKIMLLNNLVPDRVTTISVPANCNHMELNPNHDLLLVHFDKVTATIESDHLKLDSAFLRGMFGERAFSFKKVP